jgi:transposase-like protein
MTDATPFQLLPALSSDEFDSLKADIAANGQRDPLVLRAGTGEIVDGHHRSRVCAEIGVDPLVVEIEFASDAEAQAYALRVNTNRRQLSSVQWRAVRDEQKRVYWDLRSQPGWTQGVASALVGVPEGTAARWETEAKGDEPVITILRSKDSDNDDPEKPADPPPKPIDNRVKLSDEQKAHIYLLVTEYGYTQQRAADEYKVSQAVVNKIVKDARKAVEKERRKRELEEAAARSQHETADGDDLTIIPGMWIELGPHRLYCGDSSDPDFIEAANGATFAFADPPYNADAATWDTGFQWNHDYLIDCAPIVAVTPGISAIPDFMRRTEMPYVWSLAANVSNGMTRGAVGFGNWIYVALFASVSVHRQQQDHRTVTVGSHPGAEDHKGRKPPQLLTWLLDLYTKPGDLVLDPFAGSGTTLFVADQMGRRCITAEIDPDYCAAIVATYRQAVAA